MSRVWDDTSDPTGQLRFLQERRAEGLTLREAKQRWDAEHPRPAALAAPAVFDDVSAEEVADIVDLLCARFGPAAPPGEREFVVRQVQAMAEVLRLADEPAE